MKAKSHLVPCIIVLVMLALLVIPVSAKAISFEEALKDVDPSGKYFFYLHGAIVETEGKNAVDKRYGTYRYDSIVEHFEARGLIVIEEVRKKVKPMKYASKVSMQVRRLMAAGVPPSNICVAGFSKGGFITLLMASSLNESDLAYVIMAGCGRGKTARSFDRFLSKGKGSRLRGRILSIYAGNDLDAGSCQPAINQSMAQQFGNALVFKELRIRSTKGHGLFFQPLPEWVNPAAAWALGGH